MESPEEVYEKFVNFCSISLKGENPKFLDLIKSRYEGCDDDFRRSNKMVLLLERTKKNMSNEESRKFVHLKDLLTELKIKASVKKKSKKRKLSTDLEATTELVENIPKFKDCSVVMDKFPHFDASLLDQNISSVESDSSSKLYARKTCSITDGDFNSAPCIAIANDSQMDNLKKTLDCYIESPPSLSLNLDLSLSGRGHGRGKTSLTSNHSNNSDSDLPDLHTFYNTDDSKEKSHRKSVYIVGVHDITEEGCIKTRTLGDISSVDNSPIYDSKGDQQTLNCHAQCDNGHITKNELKTSKQECTLQIVDNKTEMPKKGTTIILDVMAHSTDFLAIEPSSSRKRHIEEYSGTQGDHTVQSPADCVDNAVVKSVLTSTQSSCLETEDTFRVHFGTKSDIMAALDSPISGVRTLQTESRNVPEKLSLHKPLVAQQSSSSLCISACVPTILTSVESETTLNQDCLTRDKETFAIVYGDLHRVNTSTVDIKSNEDKLPKRAFLLSSSNIGTYTSNSLFGVKPDLHSSQQKAAQKPEYSNKGNKISSSWMDTETLERRPSVEEFLEGKEHSTGLDKRKQKRVIKLECLLASLRNEIEKCQNTEISLDDLGDENTAYMYEDKLKRKFVAVWNKLCEITERSVTTGRPTEKTIKFSGTRYQEINRRIQKFLNKKKMFPDFHDIKSIVKLTNKKCNLNLSVVMINDVAREAFVDIGEMLQTRRHQDFISTFGTRQTDMLQNSMDPYLTDPEFRKKVDCNRQVAKLNLDSVITKYAQLQYDRNCGDDNDDKTEEEIVKTVHKINEEDKIENQNETNHPYFEDFVTTASIEVDMAEEGNDNVLDWHAGIIHQQPFSSYNTIPVHLGQIIDNLTSENDAPTLDKSGIKSNVSSLGHQMLEKPNCIEQAGLIPNFSKMETSNTSLVAPWQADAFKVSPSCLSSERKKAESINDQSKETIYMLTKSERRGPAIKYTARKPSPNSGFAHNSGKIDFLAVSDVKKKSVPYICVQPKMNTDVNNSDEDDKSSDSASEKDTDDKSVDEDVNEIVMIINKSESECDSASTRDPSPISIVSLSSDSLTEDDDYGGQSLAKSITTFEEYTSRKQIASSPNPFSKHWQVSKEIDSLEKRLFLHAMGITESENEAHSSFDLIDGKLCTFGKDDNVILSQQRTENETICSQTQKLFNSGIAEFSKQTLVTAGKERIIVHDNSVSLNTAVNQDDCVIIDMQGKASQLTAVVDKVSIDNEISVCAFDDMNSLSGEHQKHSEIEKDKCNFQAKSSTVNNIKKSSKNDICSMKDCISTDQNDPIMKHITQTNILTSSPRLYVENQESNHSNTKSSCRKQLDTIDLDGTMYWEFCSNHSIIDSAEPSLNKKDRIRNEDVIILDDSSVDQSFSKDSSLYSQSSLPQSQLPLSKINASFLEKHITLIGKKEILPFSQGIKDAKSKSFTEITCLFDKDMQAIDENSHKSHCSPSVLKKSCSFSDLTKGICKSGGMAKLSSEIKDLELEQSESNHLLSESVVASVNLDEQIRLNPQDVIGSSSQLVERVLKTAGDYITAEKDQEGCSKMVVCSKDAETNKSPPISEHYRDARDNEVRVTGDTGMNSTEEISHDSPRRDLISIEAAKETSSQSNMKSQKNKSVGFIKASSVINTVTNKYNEIRQEHIEVIQPAADYSVHIGSAHITADKNAFIESERTKCISDIKGFKDQDLIQSTNPHSDIALSAVLEKTYNIDFGKQPGCHSFQEEKSSDKYEYDESLSVANAERIQTYKTCNITDSVSTSLDGESCSNSTDSDMVMLPDKIKAACSNLGNESDSVLCITNVRSAGDLVLNNQVIHMKTLTNKNMEEHSVDNKIISAGKHILMDDSIDDAMENESAQQKVKVCKSDRDTNRIDYDEDSVDLLSVESQDVETILDGTVTNVSQSTECVQTKLRHSENKSGFYNLGREFEKHGHTSNLDLTIKEAQIEHCGASTYHISSVISAAQSNTSKDTVTVEFGENCEVHVENIIPVTECGKASVDISRDIVYNILEDREDVTNNGDARHEMADYYNNENATFSVNSVTCDSELIRKMGANNGREKVQDAMSINKLSERHSDDRLAEMTSHEGEDEVKIIEELSSVKGVRSSVNSKEDDRKLVDRLISDMEINQSKGERCPPEGLASVVPSCQMSEECWDICKNVGTGVKHSGPIKLVKKALPEKTEVSHSTNSSQYSSVLSVKCDEANIDGEKMQLLSVSSSLSHTASPVDSQPRLISRKRSHNESFSSRTIIHDSGDENNDEYEAVSSCVIDVELLQPDKHKVVKPDLITEFSTVLSAPHSAMDKSTFVTKNTSLVKKPLFSLSKSSDKIGFDDDDDDVVFMEETDSKSTHPVLHKGKNITSKTSAALRKYTSSNTFFVTKPISSTTNPLLVKKHEIPKSYHNSNSKSKHISPTSFQSLSHGDNHMSNSAQTLPRLMPRVPIPSIRYNRTSESARTCMNNHSSGTFNRSPDKQSQFFSSALSGRSETGYKSKVPNTSPPRKKSFNPVMVPLVSRGKSKLASYNTDRLNSHLQQTSSTRSRGALRYASSSHSVQAASVKNRTVINTGISRNKQVRSVDGMEIILGDSDEDSEFNNASSGPRIVSVASLSSSQSNTSQSDLSNVSNTEVHNQSFNIRKDIIVIPD